MRERMRRRDFLTRCGQAALTLPALALAACKRRDQEPATPPQSESLEAQLADLEQRIPRLMQAASVPGLSIAIIRDAKLFWRRAFGVKDVTTKEPVYDDTVFEAASTTKPLFAYAVMKLCEQGVLDLDTPLTKYTPERILEGDARLDLITARHVLSHSSGLQNFRSSEEPLKIHFTPGEQWLYSGEAFSYLQSVVSRLTGSHPDPQDCATFETGLRVCAMQPSIGAYLKANVLTPFGMSASDFFRNDEMERHLAHPHDERGTPSTMDRRPTRPGVARYAALGGLLTTPTDYAKFLIEVIDPKPSDAFRLGKDSLAEMLRPQVQRTAASSWALGWEIDRAGGESFLRHGGSNPGFCCIAAASVTHRSGCVIMTNAEDNAYFGVIAELLAGEALPRLLGGKLRVAPL